MFEAIARVDRSALGFTPIAAGSELRLELTRKRLDKMLFLGERNYDAMLHVAGKTSRTIAFARTSTGLEWIGEQEIFKGPREWKTVDGTFPESITITFDRVRISGAPVNTLDISYLGPDTELEWPRKLTLEIIQPVLKKWGYE